MSTQAKPGALKEHSQIRAGRALQMRLKTDYHLLRRTDICQIQFKQSYSTRTDLCLTRKAWPPHPGLK